MQVFCMWAHRKQLFSPQSFFPEFSSFLQISRMLQHDFMSSLKFTGIARAEDAPFHEKDRSQYTLHCFFLQRHLLGFLSGKVRTWALLKQTKKEIRLTGSFDTRHTYWVNTKQDFFFPHSSVTSQCCRTPAQATHTQPFCESFTFLRGVLAVLGISIWRKFCDASVMLLCLANILFL